MMNGPRRRSRNGIEAGGDPSRTIPKPSETHGDPSRTTPKPSETHGDPSRTTPKPYETHGDPRPLLRYRSDSGGEYYLTNKHSSQINSYL